MLIQPNTVIDILKNCPLDKTYEHTIYFNKNDTSTQISYFMSLRKHRLTAQSYQRYDKGVLQVQLKADDLYDCNYMMFQNTSYGSKWFYAFITNVEYVNNATSRITYEIDVMQTWHHNYDLEKCFVEREHSKTDNLFENLVKENLDLGDSYICYGTDVFDMNDMNVCILASDDYYPEGENTVVTNHGKTVHNVYSSLYVSAGLPVSDPAAINYVMDLFKEHDGGESIVAIYQYPEFLGTGNNTTMQERNKIITKNVSALGGGYVPRNKKLFSYPYNFLLVSNNAGQTAEFRWENWSGVSASFVIAGCFLTSPAVMCYPSYHRGIERDYDSGLVLKSFPVCASVGDTFKAWWAQNKSSTITNAVTSTAKTTAAGAITGGVPGAIAGGLIGGISSVVSLLAKKDDLEHTPPQIKGQAQTDSLNAAVGRVQFNFYKMGIKEQFAKIIDDFFDRYGYATHRNKIPNRAVRPYWTYTKTVGCTITGSVPADDMAKICKIYDNGITFWKSGANIGKYELNNSPA